MDELHARLLQRAVPLVVVARRTRRYDVLPDRFPTARSRDDVVERQPARGGAAVDATPAVAREERAARDLALDGPRHAHVGHEPDHVWPRIRVGRGVQRLVELLDHLGLSLEHEHVGTPHGCDIQRLVTRVQNQNLLHLGRNVAE